MIKVFIEKENRNINLEFKGIIKDLLEKLNINLETVIVLSNNEILTEDESLVGDEKIKIISVVSGG